MNAKTHVCLCLAAGWLVALAGCTANKPYRTTLPIPPDHPVTICDCRTNDGATTVALETPANGNYRLGVVELDDQGWFWSHNQWKAVKDAIATEASSNANGLVIVVFVHGWKNNAAWSNSNVETFRGMLSNMSEAVTERDNYFGFNPPRKVFGVFVGWRGLSAASDYFPPLAKEFSFYNRKDAAERIGHAGAATQVFTELEIMRDEFNAKRAANLAPTKLVIIGHSFGAALVYSAISDVLTERLVMTTRKKGEIPLRSLGDLVVLLSPAFEASLYNNLIALAASPDIVYPANQRPVLAIFTSRGDWPNKVAFPFGRFFSTLFEKSRDPNDRCLFNIAKAPAPDQKNAIRHTVGFDQEYVTYDLDYTNYSSAGQPAGMHATKPADYVSRISKLQNQWTTNSERLHPTNMAPLVFTNSNGTNLYACILKPRKDSRYADKPGNPILNVSVDTTIMAGHDDFANSNLLRFLQDFILFTGTNYPAGAAR